MAWAWRGRKVGLMVSRHRDGEIMAQVVQRLGYLCFRGSTTRGGVQALLEMTRSGVPALALTPDGPRGPEGRLQKGALLLARESDRLLVPVGVGAWPCWRAKSWDRYVIPKPFAKVRIALGEPYRVEAGEPVPRVLETLREKLARLEYEAWREAGAPDPSAMLPPEYSATLSL